MTKVYLIKFVTVGERWQPWWDTRKMNIPDDIVFLKVSGAHVYMITLQSHKYMTMFSKYHPTCEEILDAETLMQTINKHFMKIYWKRDTHILIATAVPGKLIGRKGFRKRLLESILNSRIIIGGTIHITHDLVGNTEINISDRKILQKYNLKEEQWYHTEIKFSDLPKVQHEECKRNGKTSKIIPWYDIPEWVKNLLKQL